MFVLEALESGDYSFQGVWVKDSYLLPGRCDRTGASLSCCIAPKENQVVEVKAAVQLSERKHVAIHFTLSPHEPQRAMANVIALRKTR